MKLASKHKFLTALILAAVILIAASLVWAGMNTKAGMAEQTDTIRDTVRARALQC